MIAEPKFWFCFCFFGSLGPPSQKIWCKNKEIKFNFLPKINFGGCPGWPKKQSQNFDSAIHFLMDLALGGAKKVFTIRWPPPTSRFEVYFFIIIKKISCHHHPLGKKVSIYFFLFLFFYQNCSQYPKTYNKHIKLYPNFLWYTFSYFTGW